MLGLAEGTVHTGSQLGGQRTSSPIGIIFLSTLVSSSFELVPSSFRAIFLATCCDTEYHQLPTLSKSNVPLGSLALETTRLRDTKKEEGRHYLILSTSVKLCLRMCLLLSCRQAAGCLQSFLDLCVFSSV